MGDQHLKDIKGSASIAHRSMTPCLKSDFVHHQLPHFISKACKEQDNSSSSAASLASCTSDIFEGYNLPIFSKSKQRRKSSENFQQFLAYMDIVKARKRKYEERALERIRRLDYKSDKEYKYY